MGNKFFRLALKEIFFLTLVVFISLFFSYQNLANILFLDNVVQDDFRQSFFWVWRFWDESLFQNYFFAEMYQSHLTRIPLLNLIYRSAPLISASPILFSKLLSILIAALSCIAAYFMMRSFLKQDIHKDHEAGENAEIGVPLHALSAVCFSACIAVMLWCTDYLSVAHSRSFIWLGIFVYLFLENEKKDLLKSIWISILLLLSPIAFLLCLAMQFFSWIINGVLRKNIFNKNFYSLGFNAIAVLVLYKIIFADIATQGIGREFTRSELEKLPEFNPGGRHPIFGIDFFSREWWSEGHWGLNIAGFEISVIVWAAFIIVPLYLFTIARSRLIGSVQNSINHPLSLLFLASVSLYIASSISFPLLFLPSRYIANSSFILAISSLFLIVIDILKKIKLFLETKKAQSLWGTALLLLFTTIFCFIYSNFYHPRYVSISPDLLKKIEQLPKDALIAAHPKLPAINIIPAVARRKVYVNHEWSMAYTEESLREIRRRNREAFKLIYARNKEDFLKIAKKEGITHVLVAKKFYSKKYLENPVYLEPYNAFLKELIGSSSSSAFWLNRF